MVTARKLILATGLATGLFAAHVAIAQESCGLCNREVVLDRPLATCFLQRFPELLADAGASVTVEELHLGPAGGALSG